MSDFKSSNANWFKQKSPTYLSQTLKNIMGLKL
jgi:hypothetical protein